MTSPEQLKVFSLKHLRIIAPKEWERVSRHLPAVEALYFQSTLKEIPNARSNPKYRFRRDESIDDKVRDILTQDLDLASRIEHAARNPTRWNLPNEIVKGDVLIVDFSAPGTYYQPRKNDRFHDVIGTLGSDKTRADTAAILGIHMAGLATGNDFSDFTKINILEPLDPKLRQQQEVVQTALRQKLVRFLYLGRPDEAQAINKVLHSSSSFVPPELVSVVEEGIDNTLDQVKALKKFMTSRSNNPPYTVILPMGLQAIRTLTMLEQYQAVPDNVNVTVFPIATPLRGLEEYASLEIKGALYYKLIGEAAMKPRTFTLLGHKSN